MSFLASVLLRELFLPPEMPSSLLFHFNLFFKCFFNLFFERERQGRGRERGRHRLRGRLQALSCQHRAWCGARTPERQDHDLSGSQTLNPLSHLGAPIPPLLTNKLLCFLRTQVQWCLLRSLSWAQRVGYTFLLWAPPRPYNFIIICSLDHELLTKATMIYSTLFTKHLFTAWHIVCVRKSLLKRWVNIVEARSWEACYFVIF